MLHNRKITRLADWKKFFKANVDDATLEMLTGAAGDDVLAKFNA